MEITMMDGRSNQLLDVHTRKMREVTLNQHAMRFHMYDPIENVAVEKFSTTEPKMMDAILLKAEGMVGRVWPTGHWIRIRTSKKELWPADRYRQLALRDLQTYWGDAVEITGTSIRFIYYVSDGNLNSTRDNIGVAFKNPLIYKGYAIGTIFKIGGLDVVSSERNVVYWLDKKMWEGFHTGYRGIPREFPAAGPCGFVSSAWCEREGNSGYGDGGGYRLASMIQGKTLGIWSTTSLVKRSGSLASYLKKLGVEQKSVKRNPSGLTSPTFIRIISQARKKAIYGMALCVCHKCGHPVPVKRIGNADECINCLACFCSSCLSGKSVCRSCGKTKCACGMGDFVTMSDVMQHRSTLREIRNQVLLEAF